MAKRIQISFAEDEKDIYDYLKTKRNYSVYVKDLIEKEMKKDIKAGGPNARV